MKNTFSFTLKAIFVLKILFFYGLFGRAEKNGLIGKKRLISKFMTLQPGWRAIATHIYLSISRSKGNKAMKFGQLIEYRSNLFKNHVETWECEASSRPRFNF